MKNGLMLCVFVACNIFIYNAKADVYDSLAIDSLPDESLDEIIEDTLMNDTEEFSDTLNPDSINDVINNDLEDLDDVLDMEIEEDNVDAIQDTIQIEEVKEDVLIETNVEEDVIASEELDLEQLYTRINMLDKKYFEWLGGSIRDLNGETIHGKLKYYNKYKSCRKVKFVNVDGEQKVYRAKKLKVIQEHLNILILEK